jgi:osmotically inducible lipoprotein OsmB
LAVRRFHPDSLEEKTMRLAKFGLIAVAAALLTACGTMDGDRGLSGAGIGAGFGAVGGPPGVIAGALIGAGVGMVTEPDQVNLGKPVWN